MKRLVILLLLVTTYISCSAQQKGDSLAVLYYRVYAYKIPGDLSSRYSKIPFSYINKNKLVFIANSDQNPKFFKVKTVKGDTIFVRAKLVSADQKLTHAQIEEDVKNGIRKKNFGDLFYQNKSNYPMWVSFLILGIFVVALYFLRKFFSKIDTWFCRKNHQYAKPLLKPWFINYSLYAGLVIGSMELISVNEYRWFMQDGMQIWGTYPSKWDWLMWAAVVAVGVIIIVAVIQAFIRFQTKTAIFYTVFSLFVIGLYYLGGLILGAIALVLVVFYVFISGSSGSSSGSGNSGGTNSTPGNDPSPVGAYKYGDDGQRYIKNTGGSWDKNDGIL